MSDRDPALGDQVVIRGKLVGIELATDTARIQTDAGTIAVRRESVHELSNADIESKWRAHRDANVRRGIAITGISKRDFMAGYAAAA